MRMGRRSTGACRPAPEPGVGFDHDKTNKKLAEVTLIIITANCRQSGSTRKKHGWIHTWTRNKWVRRAGRLSSVNSLSSGVMIQILVYHLQRAGREKY